MLNLATRFLFMTPEFRYKAELACYIGRTGTSSCTASWESRRTIEDKVRFIVVPLHEGTDMITVQMFPP